MKNRKFLSILALMLIALCIMPTTSKAALQSTKAVSSSKMDSATNWVINVRNMESSGGGMGLNETVGDNGIATTDSNGIDVHLQKNTEYGAAILLGASDYGKQGTVGGTGADRWMNNGNINYYKGTKIQASTTGNVTGIYELGNNSNWEWTSGGGTQFLSNIAPRYRDIYEDGTTEGKPGDATIERSMNLGTSWHGSSRGSFATGDAGFVRGSSSFGVFSFYFNYAGYSNFARACVVSAPGL